MTNQCAQVGPRGGQCRRKADAFLDFCPKHNQMVQDGISLRCWKCSGVVPTTTKRARAHRTEEV